MLEGDFRFKVGSEWLRASTGGMAFGPRGMRHAFQNTGATPGRLLIVTTPSGLERFFEQFVKQGALVGDSSSSPPSGQRTGSSSTGPPSSVSDPL